MTQLLNEMTWPALTDAISRGVTTVILPLGATEQHGPHLPLGTDTFRAQALAEGLANDLQNALVAPALPVGCSDEHWGFPGLLSLNHETLAQVIVDCAQRMVDWGVQRLILLSAHGGNGQALDLAGQWLQERLPDLEVYIPEDLTTVSHRLIKEAQLDHVSAEEVGLHAGEGETSEMLHLRPDLVLMNKAEAGYTGDMLEVVSQLQASGLQPLTASGVLGDPRPAESQRGARYLAIEVDRYKQYIQRHDPPVKIKR
jgi:creatinine amidohydrolase